MKALYLSVIALVVLVLSVKFLNLPPFKESFTCANSITCINDLSGRFEDEIKGIFMGKIVSVPSQISKIEEKAVLGQKIGVEKRIYIDLSRQMLYAYEGDNLALSFPVSTGKWYSTPTGDFRIWIKLRYTRMAGGDKRIGTYYNLPNVPHVMYFYNSEYPKAQGYGLHGAYWHNNFGHPMSHGCINIGLESAERLYSWADPPIQGNTTYASAQSAGTSITIYGTTPVE